MLIPAKAEIGRVSKQLLDRINAINPDKAEIGRVRKQLLDRINVTLAHKLELHQWKNTKPVLSWFNNIQHKDMYSFIAFKQKVLFSTVLVSLGVKKLRLIFLTSPWGVTTALNLASLLVLISFTRSKRGLATHAFLAYREMAAPGYPTHHHGKLSSSKKICAIFSEVMA